MSQPCTQMEVIGKIKEFMENSKGLKITMFMMAATIVTQVVTFAYLWGGLTTTVKKNSEYLWGPISSVTVENTRNIDKILSKFDITSVKQVATGVVNLTNK